ncbi:olfactory receptor 4C6-like [Hyperolius riggenbachi]|uniref:olfactory receptor 4C6-like n=1 Tax=Hyperolius riggenbachi TaxID=752182 RepID=UPI0035A3442E
MSNISNSSTSFLLIGLLEMENLKYLYSVVCLAIYVFIMFLSLTLVYTVFTEPSLHKPMYILISNLVLNGIFGSSSLYPKLIIDLLSSSNSISREGCLTQAFCILSFAYCEICTFTLMAYDRYLAVCQPLHYVKLMTNKKVLCLTAGYLVFVFTVVLVAVLLSARLPVCGTYIKNIFCDNISFFVLSCVDSTVNNLYGAIVTTSFLTVTLTATLSSYLRIFLICVKLSKEARQKALHTLMTHLVNFSVFLLGFFFIFIRFRLGKVDIPLVSHILFSIPCLIFPPILNPLIFGIRTKALKSKLIHHFQKIK